MNDFNVYRVFLLRLWQESDGTATQSAPLRIVLEEPRSGKRQSFPSLQALLVHLQDEMAREESRAPSESKEECQ